MKKKSSLLIFIISYGIQVWAQVPTIDWQNSLGGTGVDLAYTIEQTVDGGYILGGSTSSNNGDVSGNHGGRDYWVVKQDILGNLQWQRTLGGTNWEVISSIQQTIDGGYIVAGTSDSNDGDVSGNHDSSDVWIVKLDSAGNIVWQKSLGSTYHDRAWEVKQTTDTGYIIASYVSTNDGDVSGHQGMADYWIVKLDNNGDIEWSKALGGTNEDKARSIKQTNDGGYIVAGYTDSDDGDVTENYGESDYWIVKLDVLGSIQWQKSIGGTGLDYAYSIQQTLDNGYIIAGRTNSNDGDVSGNHGGYDFWVVKLDASSNIQWQKTLGGTGDDGALSIKQTADTGYIVAGYTISNDGDVDGNHGSDDYWIVKLNNLGELLWQKALGGSGDDYAEDIVQTIDGGFIITGFSDSNDGDVLGNHGNRDVWVVKLSSDVLTAEEFNNSSVKLFPNPVLDVLTINTNILELNNIKVFDSSGRLVLVSESKTVSTASLLTGSYIIKVIFDSNVITKKMIKI